MSFQFECKQCNAVTIFKEIESVPRNELTCANCDKYFNVKRDLMKFNRQDKGSFGMIASEDGSLETRIRKLVDQYEDLADRCERLEYLIMDERGEVQRSD